MIDLYLTKTIHGLSPDDQMAVDALAAIKLGTRVRCQVTRQQNAAFHRKMMALLSVGFRYWVPGDINTKYGKPEKNFDRFRKDCTILAGFYEIHTRLDGSTRVEAKSISYGSMPPEEREELYSKIIDVLLKHIFTNYTAADVIDMANQEILNFV